MRGLYTRLSAYIKRGVVSKLLLRKKEHNKFKATKRKDITKIKAKINEVEIRKKRGKINVYKK